MANVAIIEAKPSFNDYSRLFDSAFEFDHYHLCSNPDLKKVLKKDVDINIDIDNYQWVVLVGADVFKFYTKQSAITTYTGKIVDEKFLPVINPAMIKFKPEAKKPWEESKANIIGYITGEKTAATYDTDAFIGIQDTEEINAYIKRALDAPGDYFGLDSETSALYPRNGYMIGMSLSFEKDSGAYMDTDYFDEMSVGLLQDLLYEKTPVFHNAKFDLGFFEYHFGLKFPTFHDTMLMHSILDENSPHGLKDLAMKYTKYGDYEKELDSWRAEYCRKNGVLKADFSYDLIPFDIMKKYAAIDAAVTIELFEKLWPYVQKNAKLLNVYNTIMIPGCRMLTDVQSNGVPFDMDRLLFGQQKMQEQIDAAVAELSAFPEIATMEKNEGKPFNPNSTVQLRKLLFDYIKLKPTGKLTGTGAASTDSEVLEQLGELHPVPKHISAIRKSSKIKNTYLDKIIPQLDMDGRLRTGFNQHVTTSGRLSSSGKLNMQQLPRDNPTVKGCIKAKPGHKIVAMDLLTAEMWVAAALSGDLELQDVFRSGGNFHSTIAKKVFSLDCPVEEVAEKHGLLRQSAKAVSFGILYGASAGKIADTVTKEGTSMSKAQAQQVINEYFGTFWKLKEWIEETQAFIKANGYVYSPFGRKRRLLNVKSTDRGVVGHEVRSGLNFIIQSVASDINLLGCIDMNDYIKQTGMKAQIFGLVHDSVLAEVPEDEIEHYSTKLEEFIKKDRGCFIKGAPVGCDFDIAEDYSLGKFTKLYGDNI